MAAKALGITVGDFVGGDGDRLQWRKILSGGSGRLRDIKLKWFRLPHADPDGRFRMSKMVVAESSGNVDEVQGPSLVRGTAAEVSVLVMTRGCDREGECVVSWADALGAEQEER